MYMYLLGIYNYLKLLIYFQILLEAVKGRSYSSDIAVDDVSLTPGCTLSTNGELETFLHFNTVCKI